jgi:hypothetical protein
MKSIAKRFSVMCELVLAKVAKKRKSRAQLACGRAAFGDSCAMYMESTKPNSTLAWFVGTRPMLRNYIGASMDYQKQRLTEEQSPITVGDLMRQLSGYDKDTEITFGSTLDANLLVFYRVKRRGDDFVQIELNELRD